MRFYYNLLLLLICFSENSIAGEGTGIINLQFEHYVNAELLRLDSVLYKNELGQTFNVTKFRYYVSNIVLKNDQGKEVFVNEYFLIDEDKPASKKIELKVPVGNYNSIVFMIGVDSLHNCSGLQEGALDPVNGMFWAWNTGYVFLKLEGKSPESKSIGNIFEYHIGGFKEPSNCIRTVNLEMNTTLNVSETSVSLKIKTDIFQLFSSKNKINIVKLPTVTDFHNATFVADNFVKMFSIDDKNVK